MGKVKPAEEVSEKDVNCLKNFVVAYNTVFLMSSIFIVSIAATTYELYSDFHRLLSPSVLLLMVGAFIVFVAGLGYTGVAKDSSTLIGVYTLMLVFILVLEVAAGFGISSFSGEIKPMVTSKMRKAMAAYSEDPMTANLLDFIQIQLECCGINNYWDWDNVLDNNFRTNCEGPDYPLPQSCCKTFNISYGPVVHKKGCLPALHFSLHRSGLLIMTAIIIVCVIQVLGTYFSYSLGVALYANKKQKAINQRPISNKKYSIPPEYKEKSNYF